jgi:probable HAF family extracellular repeat protein
MLPICATVGVGFGALIFPSIAGAACTFSSPCGSSPVSLGTIDSVTGTSVALGTNADGSVIVGQSATGLFDQFGNTLYHAFRSTADGQISDLGTLGNVPGVSIATATSADGSVVVGQSSTSLTDAFGTTLSHAFRWTTNGGMADLGTLQNVVGNSRANGTSADGSVVVGFSAAPQDPNGSTYYHAFRWTYTDGMRDLGTIKDTVGFSTANAISGDGSVVVGESAIPKIQNSFFSHAFRWTNSGGMADLGTIGNVAGYSAATATNFDGSVVVGRSTTPTDPSGGGAVHAFRWTNSTGMVDISTPGGSPGNSRATGVSGDGAVVIGQYSGSCSECGELPFRWTEKTGTQDLNMLLQTAGVLPQGTLLYSANGISTDGQFIVGSAKFDSDPAYIVRYFDGAGTTIAALTTTDSLYDSVDQLSAGRLSVMVHQNAISALLLGSNEPITNKSMISAYGAAGSASAGTYMQISNSVITLFGGLAYTEDDYAHADVNSSLVAALAIRAEFGHIAGWKILGEIGGWGIPDGSFTFSRDYTNGAGRATGLGTSEGGLFYVYGRIGAVALDTQSDQIVLSFEAAHEGLKLTGYNEYQSEANPFEADIASGRQTLNSLKLRSQWSHKFYGDWDYTVWTALSWGSVDVDGLGTSIAGIGFVSPSTPDSTVWAEYGARFGFKFDEHTSFNTFVDGVFAESDVGQSVHAGVSIRSEF